MKVPTCEKVTAVLTPVFALRGEDDLGIGDTAALRDFIDWAADCGVKVVKLLPINETGSDHSPYNAISSRALEPATLHLSPDHVPGLQAEHVENILAEFPPDEDLDFVDYPRVKLLKQAVLENAFNAFFNQCEPLADELCADLDAFASREEGWLREYTLFRALMERGKDGEAWSQWPAELQSPEGARQWVAGLALSEQAYIHQRVMFFTYVQWVAFRQWRDVKAHAESRGIALMGDIPFGVSHHSADVWARRHLFQSGWYGGTPPDKFFKHDAFVQKWGQNWGIPLYDWDAHRAEDLAWWRERVSGVREFFDLFRIDHILGFFRVYGFPWSPELNEEFAGMSEAEVKVRTEGRLPRFHPRPDDNQANREKNRAEGASLLQQLLEEAGQGNVIGEDLGEIPEYVPGCLRALGIGGYKVPQWQQQPDGSLVDGDSYEPVSVAAYGTHDHDPMRAMWETLAANANHDLDAAGQLQALSNFAGISAADEAPYLPVVHSKLVAALLRTNSWMAVFMITDVFARSERFNFPGVASDDNWTRRLHKTVSELRSDPLTRVFKSLVTSLRPSPMLVQEKPLISHEKAHHPLSSTRPCAGS